MLASVRAIQQERPRECQGQRWGFGAFLLTEAVFILSAVFIGAIARRLMPDPADSVTVILVASMVPTVLAAGVAVLATVVRGNGPLIDLRLQWRWSDVKVGLKLGLAGLALTYVAAAVWSKVVGQQNATSAIGSLVDGKAMPVSAAVVMFLYVCLLAPLCEELIYRGLLWGAIERLRWSRWAAFVLSTAIFAAGHLEPLRTSLLLVIALPIGFARLITGRLTASVVAHVINNFLPGLTFLLISLGVMRA
nr:type II CAAX endopeptidase family protein [Solihabitans fulvus]